MRIIVLLMAAFLLCCGQSEEKPVAGKLAVEIISDPQQVEELRKTIEQNIAQKQKEEAALVLTPWQRYKKGDTLALPGLITILRGNDSAKKYDLYYGLGKNFDDPANYAITEPALITEIFKGVNDPQEEKGAVQLAGLNKIPGYELAFENRLLSGKSTDEGRIFFWLGRAGKSIAAFGYVDARLKASLIKGKDLDWVIHGLEGFGENGDTAMQRRVGEMALYIYNNEMSREKVEELQRAALTTYEARSLLNSLFDYGDRRVLPIAEELYQKNITTLGPLKAMLRLDGEQHVSKIYTYLRNHPTFYEGLDLMESIDRKYIPEEMLKEALVTFSTFRKIEDDRIDKIVQSYINMNAGYLLKDADKIIRNKEVVTRIQKRYALTQFDPQQIVDELVSLDLIDQKPDDSTIAALAKEDADWVGSFILSVLREQRALHYFDDEPDGVPVDYDNLIMDFAANSRGALKDIRVWMDAKKGSNYKYTITVLSGNKAFIIRPPDGSHWYDLELVNQLLDDVLEHLPSERRFTSLDAGGQWGMYIFGEPKKVQRLIKKYDL